MSFANTNRSSSRGGAIRCRPTSARHSGDICACRTAALGARLEQCDHCSQRSLVFHSCRNRACPKCQSRARDRWLGSWPALVALGAATVLEVGAYYLPWLDHALDLVATPAAVLAGMLVSASVLTELPPVVRWIVPLIGGGGLAGLIQGASVLLRLKSAAFTGGIANPIVSTAELAGATVTALLAVLMPVLCLVGVLTLIAMACRATGRLLFGRRPSVPGNPTPASPQ